MQTPEIINRRLDPASFENSASSNAIEKALLNKINKAVTITKSRTELAAMK